MSGKAVILLSGGIDSSTTLLEAKRQKFELYALSISYGQRHSLELESAKKIANAVGVAYHKLIEFDLGTFRGSALTDVQEIPVVSDPEKIGEHIPATYVPARNTVFLSLALSWAETLDARSIFIGVNAIDYSGYPDCRPEFIECFEQLANLGTKAGVEGRKFKIETPLIDKTKAEIIKLGHELGLDFSMTNSCYDPDEEGNACGRCDSCYIRRIGFQEAGLIDPIKYISTYSE